MIFVNTPCNLASLRTIWKMCSFLWLRKTTWIESRGQNYENAGNRTSERKANRRNPRVAGCWHAVAAFPLAKDTGLAHTFATAADKQTVRRFLCGLSALLILGLTALGGGGLAAAALLALWRYDFVAKRQFGGITGDLAGWFLQRAELWMLAALAVSQWGGVL